VIAALSSGEVVCAMVRAV